MNVTSTIRNIVTFSLVLAGATTLAWAAENGAKPTVKKQSPPHPPFGPEAAQADMKKLSPGKGLEANLFASEPMVVNPCDMDVDSQGRVWITEGANYRSSFQKWGLLRPEGDRIVVLQDKNGDGNADSVSTFYQDLSVNAALGICVLGNKVIVSSAPNVFVLTDTDGDGKADKRELMFTGIALPDYDHDHAVHAFVFGPDGKLYFNFGNAGKQLKRPSSGLKEIDLHGKVSKEEMDAAVPVLDVEGLEVTAKGKPYRQGMVFRCNLDGSEVEVLGHNFRNNYEVAVDSFGTLWQSDNDDDGNRGVRINYVMEHGNFGYTDEINGASWGTGWKKAQAKGASESEKPSYHWYQQDPGVVPNLLQTGNGSPAGICIYEGNLLPEVFQNQVIHCDAGPRVVRAYPVQKKGAGYSASIENILTSADSWYRPSDVCVGPDGSLYIADWNDANVGGHYMADSDLSKMTGRVYRVAPPGKKPTTPKLNLKSAAGCIAALRSPNHEARYLAWTELHKMGSKAEGELVKLSKDSNPRMRARALQLLARIEGKSQKYVDQALQDKDDDVRITGLRMARALKLDVISYVKTLAKDPSAQLRRECALALRHNTSPEAPALWATLAQQHDPSDRWYLEALGIGADKQENKFFEAWLTGVGDNWNTAAGRDIVWRSRASKAPELLVKIITDKNTDAAQKDHYMRALDFIKGPEKDAALLQIATGGL
ncbi:MAG TPA: PVC-type heme-binding CxxCH protein [Candidatus Saccharimonadales bacterium]|nr:PVC-type heme-binding CxxCH protein [Candidatus Saccharimonadales bacterium]